MLKRCEYLVGIIIVLGEEMHLIALKITDISHKELFNKLEYDRDFK